MCNRVAERMDRFQNWIDRVWFSDEVHFHLNGAVDHHYNVYWEDERPEEIDVRCLKGPKVTALCALKGCFGHTGLRIAKEEQSIECYRVVLNGECYREVLNRINEDLNQLYTQNRLLWLQHDSVTPHTAHATMAH